jgi:hypothetical protein
MSDFQSRSTAIHEAGHAVMAYLLRRPFKSVSVIADDDSYGRVQSDVPGKWFRPDLEVSARARSVIEDRVVITLAGGEAEWAWYAWQPDAPDGWQDHVQAGMAGDLRWAIDLAYYAAGESIPELEAYVEWLRQKVLSYTGRGADYDVTRHNPKPHDSEVKAYRDGNERFWTLVNALADALLAGGELSWQEARRVLRDADPWLVSAADVAAWQRRLSGKGAEGHDY